MAQKTFLLTCFQRTLLTIVVNISVAGHKHLHSHNHDHYGAHVPTTSNHQKYNEHPNDNPTITITTPNNGYNNDVLKYIRDHNIKTLSSMANNKSDRKPEIPQTTSTTTSATTTTTQPTSTATTAKTNEFLNGLHDYNMVAEEDDSFYDPFMGYEMSENEYYYGW